jgi:DNA invertase Pin-like site-specific DNA recombinase
MIWIFKRGNEQCPSTATYGADQWPEPDLTQLHAAGCAKVYSEKVSGARTDRPELAKLLRRLDEGDVLMVTRLDHLAQSTRDRLNVDTISKAGAGFKSLADVWADTTTAHAA